MLHTGWLQENPGQVTQCICFQGAEHGLLGCRSLVEEEAVDVNLRDAWDAVPLYYACRSGKRFARHCQVEVRMHDDYNQSAHPRLLSFVHSRLSLMIYMTFLLLHYTSLQLHYNCGNLHGMLLALDYNGHAWLSQRQHLGLQLACITKEPTALQAHL